MTPGTCRLCLQPRDLVKSHIYSEFLYADLYDEKHKAVLVMMDQERIQLVQKGIREPLLCGECEQHISRWEQYASEVWFGPDSLRRRPNRMERSYEVIEGLDLNRFKLFLLSILWRASVCTRTEFSQVQLGPHEARLRELLLNEDPGEAESYRIWSNAIVDRNSREFCDGLVVPPERFKEHGHTLYTAVFGGCIWYYRVSLNATDDPRIAYLGHNGKFTLGRVFSDDFHRMTEVAPRVAAALEKWRAKRRT